MAPSDLNLEAQIRRFWEIHFFLTPHFSFFFWKIGSTSAARNLAQNTLYPPLLHIF